MYAKGCIDVYQAKFKMSKKNYIKSTYLFNR